jgi:hypothetical protein
VEKQIEVTENDELIIPIEQTEDILPEWFALSRTMCCESGRNAKGLSKFRKQGS